MPINQDEPWYKHAIIYQVHVRTFYDSNGDGIGDFRGLDEKLDYLSDLGINTIWLMPFFPSPLRDDGYDIADYYSVHSSYGTLEDFKKFLVSAHERQIKVIIEMVLNHTSDQHPWFQESRSSQDNPRRDWYVWRNTDTGYGDARIIFLDSEMSNWAWDTVSKSYYWHRFFNHQPDLNYDNPAVRDEMWNVMKFWLELGVDGFRLHAGRTWWNARGRIVKICRRRTPSLRSCDTNSMNSFPARCFWRKPISGRRIFDRTSPTGMNSTWHFISR